MTLELVVQRDGLRIELLFPNKRIQKFAGHGLSDSHTLCLADKPAARIRGLRRFNEPTVVPRQCRLRLLGLPSQIFVVKLSSFCTQSLDGLFLVAGPRFARRRHGIRGLEKNSVVILGRVTFRQLSKNFCRLAYELAYVDYSAVNFSNSVVDPTDRLINAPDSLVDSLDGSVDPRNDAAQLARFGVLPLGYEVRQHDSDDRGNSTEQRCPRRRARKSECGGHRAGE